MSPDKEEEKEATLPFVGKYLPEYFKEKAQRELNETPEKRVTGLEEMKKMATDHKLLCDIKFVDDFLLQFLRHRKYDVSKAFKQLVNFVSLKKNHNYLFLSLHDDILSHPLQRQLCTILPYRCPAGCTILLAELGKWDPEEISFQEYRQIGIMLVTQALRDPMTQINGFKIIYDFTNIKPLKHARYCTPTNIYHIYHGGVDCYPCRYKEIHFVSDSLLMKAAWTITKAFLSQKLKQRIFLNSSRKDLLNHFPPNVLPAKYGGVLEDYYMMDWTKEANQQQEIFTVEGQCNYY